MKKTIKSVLAVLVICTLCLGLLAGCAGGGVVGTWKVTGAELNGTSVDLATLGSTANDSFTINEDHTVSAFGITGGNWTLNGNTLSITNPVGSSISCEFNGTNIIFTNGAAKLIYSRV